MPWDIPPYTVENGQWYKGNLHGHSYWSDGNQYPEMILEWYRDRGYHFVSLTEHNLLAEDEEWRDVSRGTEEEGIFRDYLKTFGDSWVEYEENTQSTRVRLKSYEEYKSRMEEDSQFLVIRGEEITDSNQERPIHVNAINLEEAIQPQGGGSDADMLQNNIDAVWSQSRSSGEPILSMVNHPYNEYAITPEDIMQLERVRFMEVFSPHPTVWTYTNSKYAAPPEWPGEMWDKVNTHYRLNGKSLIYGLATDDAHEYHQFALEYSNPGRGWIHVWSEELTEESLIRSMRSGKFYATSGVHLSRIRVNDAGISLRIDGEEGVRYRTQFIGTLKGSPGKPGQVLAETEGTNPAYDFSGDELFVRVRVISDKAMEAFREKGVTEEAWTQPVIPGKEVHNMGR